MLRVVIADDEERICNLIRALADWPALGMEVVGLAYNGPNALELVRTLQPDILVTDIRMPGCDGLEVIRRGKETKPDLEIVIISGYAQFDYAQTAIQYGVGDYLLKPVNQEALNHTLQKLGERCLSRRAAQTDLEALRLSHKDDHDRLRKKLISDLTAGDFALHTPEEMENVYRFHPRQDCMQVFLLKIDYDSDRFAEASLDIVREKAEDIFRPILAAHCDDYVFDLRQDCLYGVVSYPSHAMAALRAGLRECLNQLVELQGLFGPVSFAMALGQPSHDVPGLSSSFENARVMLCERLMEGSGRLLEGVPSPSPLRPQNLIARYMQDMAQAVDVLNERAAEQAIATLEDETMAVAGVRGVELLELVQDAALLFITRLAPQDREQVLTDFEKRCARCSSAHALFDCLRILQREQMALAAERRRNQDGQPIRVAKQYIQQYFANPITLEEVSDASGFSVNYFSTLFKKETGEGFAKYLTKIRMEEARNLLRETRLSVAEVCKRVGYVDLKHFTQTFKTATGLTPGEFRKLYG